MKLTEPQIQELYKFTRKHFVEWYDLQTELVDHLANGIEQQWQQNPKRTFDDALKVEFKKFGVFGFMDVVEQRQKALGKKYQKALFGFVKEWFKLPKFILTVSIFLFFYFAIQFKTGIYLLGFVLFVLAVGDLYLANKLKKTFNKRFEANGKKWLLEEIIFNTATFGGVIVSCNLPQLFSGVKNTPTTLFAVITAFLITLAIIYSYVVLVVIPSKAEKLLEETYPEYKIA